MKNESGLAAGRCEREGDAAGGVVDGARVASGSGAARRGEGRGGEGSGGLGRGGGRREVICPRGASIYATDSSNSKPKPTPCLSSVARRRATPRSCRLLHRSIIIRRPSSFRRSLRLRLARTRSPPRRDSSPRDRENAEGRTTNDERVNNRINDRSAAPRRAAQDTNKNKSDVYYRLFIVLPVPLLTISLALRRTTPPRLFTLQSSLHSSPLPPPQN